MVIILSEREHRARKDIISYLRISSQSVLAGIGSLSFSPLARSAGLFYPQHYANAQDTTAFWAQPRTLNLYRPERGEQGWLELVYGYREPYHVSSGYRTVHTNALTEGAVKNSYHTKGMAVDGKYPDLPVAYQGQLIAAFQGGGVGFYLNKKHDFIHADVGQRRYWRG